MSKVKTPVLAGIPTRTGAGRCDCGGAPDPRTSAEKQGRPRGSVPLPRAVSTHTSVRPGEPPLDLPRLAASGTKGYGFALCLNPTPLLSSPGTARPLSVRLSCRGDGCCRRFRRPFSDRGSGIGRPGCLRVPRPRWPRSGPSRRRPHTPRSVSAPIRSHVSTPYRYHSQWVAALAQTGASYFRGLYAHELSATAAVVRAARTHNVKWGMLVCPDLNYSDSAIVARIKHIAANAADRCLYIEGINEPNYIRGSGAIPPDWVRRDRGQAEADLAGRSRVTPGCPTSRFSVPSCRRSSAPRATTGPWVRPASRRTWISPLSLVTPAGQYPYEMLDQRLSWVRQYWGGKPVVDRRDRVHQRTWPPPGRSLLFPRMSRRSTLRRSSSRRWSAAAEGSRCTSCSTVPTAGPRMTWRPTSGCSRFKGARLRPGARSRS